MNSYQDIFKKKNSSRILIYGIGNPSRQDDALGIVFVEKLQEWADREKLENISFDSNYQLNIEDAYDVSEKDVLVFVDASVEPIDGFFFRQIFPGDSISISTHSMSPESVLSLSEELYGKKPSAFLLTIKGFSWELDASMTDKAVKNLNSAIVFVMDLLK
ncbi:MAG: hydrogenase maturation protease [Lentisphaerae bacterium]|nr:hydrogenase maturation protease [Lentisphaerota bacterium]